MKKAVQTATVRQIQELDKLAIEDYGIPSLSLMENAGGAVAREIIHILGKVKKSHVCVVCGLGNNAGDGFVIARHLINAGVKTSIFLIGKGGLLKHDAAVNYKILKKLKYPIKEVAGRHACSLLGIQNADIIVDAIFGVGLNRDILDPFRSTIEMINQSGKKVIAVDIPSGLDGTTGKIYGACIKADVTVTFSFAKTGFFKNQGPQRIGEVIVADIGIPLVLREKVM